MKTYQLYGIDKLKTWIIVFTVICISMLFSTVGDIIVAIGIDIRILFTTPTFFVLFILTFIGVIHDIKSLVRCKKAEKDHDSFLRKGKLVRLVPTGFYQTIAVEVDGKVVNVEPKLFSRTYNEFFYNYQGEINLLYSEGRYFLLVEKIAQNKKVGK